ncbi:hypothetical protein V8F33_006308 [Rhypophila sp. PSN 637]
MNFLALNYDVKRLVLGRLRQSDLSTPCLTNSELYQNAQPILYSSIRLRYSIGLPDAHDWVRDLRGGRLEAYLAVLLLNLPSVRFLNIVPRTDYHHLGQALSILRGENSANDAQRSTHIGSLRNLEQMSCLGTREEHLAPTISYHTADLLHIFYLPALKRLSIHMHIDPVAGFPWPDASPPCAARLEYLSIAQLHELHLGPILSSAANLQTLHWNRGAELSGPWASYEPSKTGSNDLAQFQGPLRSLSLVEFDEIIVLEIPIKFVMEHSSRTIQMNHFPPNLQILTLATNSTRPESADGSVYFNAMGRWLGADTRRETPYLKKLKFVTPVREHDLKRGSREALQWLREATSLVGIEFVYGNYGYYRWRVKTESSRRRGRCLRNPPSR